MRFSQLIKIGSFFLIATAISAAEMDVSIGTDPFGETTITVSAPEGSRIDPLDTPQVQGLRIVYAGQMRGINWVNGKVSHSFSLKFRIINPRPGRYTLPAFAVKIDGKKTYTEKQTFSIQQSRDPFDSAFGDDNEGDTVDAAITSLISFRHKSYYIGEALPLSYNLRYDENSNVSLGQFSEPPVNNGFFTKEIDSDRVAVRSGGNLVRTVKQVVLVPVNTGDLTVGGGKIVAGSGPFARMNGQEYPFPEETVKVKALPLPVPDDFCSAVGMFQITADAPSGDFQQFAEINIHLVIQGEGNFFTMKDPAIPSDDLSRVTVKALEPKFDLADGIVKGSKEYIVSFIPLKEGALPSREISLSALNPDTGKYYQLKTTIPSFMIKAAAEEAASVEKSGSASISALAIFAGIVGIAGVGVLLLVLLRERRAARTVRRTSNPVKPAPSVEKNATSNSMPSSDHLRQKLIDKMEHAVIAGDPGRLLSESYAAISFLCEQGKGGEFSDEKEYLEKAKYGGISGDSELLRETALKILKALR